MDVYNKNIPLPFPLTKGESEHYSNEKIKKLGFEFTDILSGMRATANYYLGR